MTVRRCEWNGEYLTGPLVYSGAFTLTPSFRLTSLSAWPSEWPVLVQVKP